MLSIWKQIVMNRNRSLASEPDALTALILEVFRLNGALISAGDELVSDLGLTSARWQVLGAIALAPAAETVARLARSMGLHRQGVQRIVNELAAEDIVVLEDNPHHRRARLVRLTKKGETLFQAAGRRQRPWARHLARGLDARTVDSARQTLVMLRRKLELAAFEA
jgi:DNA-binding MarR family transcriptional regulator